tara:strand:- start:63959 stop:64618 length:660 start_codon:yes stop_codon:yes gene_type:complete
MKKVICFSLWGDSPKYTVGALKNIQLAKEIFPEWICRFYIGKSVPISIIENIVKFDNTEIIIMNEPGDWTGMFWRFYAASDQNVYAMISRDTDSRLTYREKKAVDQWLASEKDFHIMRDHPHHATEILGGMWGVKNNFLNNMKNLIQNYKKGDFWQVDQNFLKEIIYPIVKDNSCVHDEFFERKPFPIARENYEFVGQIFDENENTVLEHKEILKRVLG